MTSQQSSSSRSDADTQHWSVRECLDMVRRTARRSAGSFLGVWWAATLAEYMLARRLIAQWTQSDLGTDFAPCGSEYLSGAPPAAIIGLGCASLIGLAAFKIALYRPLREIVLEDRSLSSSTIIGSALGRVGAVLRVQIAIALLLTAVMVVASLLGSLFPLFVLLPAALTWAPATYLASAREWSALESLSGALRLMYRHWGLVFAAHGIALCVALVGNGSGLTPSVLEGLGTLSGFETLRALSIHSITSYLGWLTVASAYLVLDVHVIEDDR